MRFVVTGLLLAFVSLAVATRAQSQADGRLMPEDLALDAERTLYSARPDTRSLTILHELVRAFDARRVIWAKTQLFNVFAATVGEACTAALSAPLAHV